MKAEQTEPSFWNRVTEADAKLLRHLLQGNLEQHLGNITAVYQRAFGTGLTQRQLAAVVDQFDFLIEMLSAGGRKSAAKNLEALGKLRATCIR